MVFQTYSNYLQLVWIKISHARKKKFFQTHSNSLELVWIKISYTALSYGTVGYNYQ